MNDGESKTTATLMADAQAGTTSQRQRLAAVRAREHVGAAGWAQTSILENIIRAGQEGLAATDTLRQVVSLTSEQLRSLPLQNLPGHGDEHLQTLEDIVRNGEEQISVAQALDEILCEALDAVATTPSDEVNVSRLKAIHGRVQQQVEVLETIINAAQAQADTFEQVAELEQISARHQEEINALRQLSAEQEVATLGAAGEDIISRITELDQAHPQQIEALSQIGQAVIEGLPDTGADAEAQTQALRQLAQTASAKIRQLEADQAEEECAAAR